MCGCVVLIGFPMNGRLIFEVAAISQVDKHGSFRCVVRSDRGRDTGWDTRRAVGSWSHYIPSLLHGHPRFVQITRGATSRECLIICDPIGYEPLPSGRGTNDKNDRLKVRWLSCEWYHDSKRCSRDTCPESYITKYTSIRRLNLAFLKNNFKNLRRII